MLIIEDKKYIKQIFRGFQQVESSKFMGWWNELENKFMIGHNDNLNTLIDYALKTSPLKCVLIIYATKMKHGLYYHAFIRTYDGGDINCIADINASKILYKHGLHNITSLNNTLIT